MDPLEVPLTDPLEKSIMIVNERALLDPKTKKPTKYSDKVLELFLKTHYISLFSKGFSMRDVFSLENKWYTESNDVSSSNANQETESDSGFKDEHGNKIQTINIPIYTNLDEKNHEGDEILIHHFKSDTTDFPNLHQKSDPFLRGFSKVKFLEMAKLIENHLKIKKMNNPNIVPSTVPIDLDVILFVKPIVYKNISITSGGKYGITITKENSLEILIAHYKRHFPPNGPIVEELHSIMGTLQDYRKEIHLTIREKRREYKKQLPFFKYHMEDGKYSIISEGKISFYDQNDKRIGKTFFIDMVHCGSVMSFGEGKMIYIIGTYCGLLYIIDQDCKIQTILYFHDAILKIRVKNHQYMIFTTTGVYILIHNNQKDILVKIIKNRNEFILDGDIFVDSIALLTKKLNSPEFYLKIRDITIEKESRRIENEGKTFVSHHGENLDADLKTNGYRIQIPNRLFQKNFTEFFNIRSTIGILPFDLLHFNTQLKYKQEGEYECLDTVNSSISIVDYEGNFVIYSTTPL